MPEEWTQARTRRRAREERKLARDTATGRTRRRYEEWECSRCGGRTFLSLAECRKCSKAIDHAADSYVDARGWVSAFPDAHHVQPQHQQQPAAARQPQPQKSTQSALAQTREQLRQALAADFPEHCVQMLRDDITRLEEQDKAARPIGQQIDQARAKLNRAVARCEKAEATIAKAQAEFEAARVDITESHVELAKLMDETAASQHAKAADSTMQDTIVLLQRTLANLARTVEGCWISGPGMAPPTGLVAAMQTTTAALQRAEAVTGSRVSAAPATPIAEPPGASAPTSPSQFPQVGVNPEPTQTQPPPPPLPDDDNEMRDEEQPAPSESRSQDPERRGRTRSPPPRTATPAATGATAGATQAQLRDTLARAQRLVPTLRPILTPEAEEEAAANSV